MYAFWEYDGRFGCLGAKVVGGILPGGRFYVEGYDGMAVKPVVLLPDDEGEKVNKDLTELAQHMEERLRQIKEEYAVRAHQIAPFLKK